MSQPPPTSKAAATTYREIDWPILSGVHSTAGTTATSSGEEIPISRAPQPRSSDLN